MPEGTKNRVCSQMALDFREPAPPEGVTSLEGATTPLRRPDLAPKGTSFKVPFGASPKDFALRRKPEMVPLSANFKTR